MDVQPLTLQGSSVRLEPLAIDHLPGLARVGLDPELWRWIPTNVKNAEDMRVYLDRALDEQRQGASVPFAIIAQSTGDVIGSTRYMNIDRSNRRLEIGCTWLTAAYQRGRSNTEAKLMLLTHAFEMLGAIRVELKTDALNQKSRTAIARIGAKEEGTFRKHLVTDTGRIRDTVYFSIIDTEWPAVKKRLTGLIQAPTKA